MVSYYIINFGTKQFWKSETLYDGNVDVTAACGDKGTPEAGEIPLIIQKYSHLEVWSFFISILGHRIQPERSVVNNNGSNM